MVYTLCTGVTGSRIFLHNITDSGPDEENIQNIIFVIFAPKYVVCSS